jgi:hypothetical protein
MYSPTDHVADLLEEVGVVGQLERLGAVGLQPERPPDPADRRLRQAGGLGHAAGAPVGSVPGLGLQRLGDDLLDVRVGDLARRPGARLVGHPVEAPLDEPPPPLADGLGGDTELGGDALVIQAVGAGEDDPGPLRQPLGALGSARPSRQGLALVVGEEEFGLASASGHGQSPFEGDCTAYSGSRLHDAHPGVSEPAEDVSGRDLS